MATQPGKTRLTVHIGAGKTGSTSIQFTLQRNLQSVQEQGRAYLGLMLENVPGAVEAHDWCVAGRPQAYFQATDHGRVDAELAEVLEAELERLSAAGIPEAIWSNEAFLPRSGRIIPVLRRIADPGAGRSG